MGYSPLDNQGEDLIEKIRNSRGESRACDSSMASDELLAELRPHARRIFQAIHDHEMLDCYTYATLSCYNVEPKPIGIGIETSEGIIWCEPVPASNSRMGKLVKTGYQLAFFRRQDRSFIYARPGRLHDVLVIIKRPDNSMQMTTLGGVFTSR